MRDISFTGGAARLPVCAVPAPHLKTASVCLSVAYGSRHDSVGRGGMAHLLEHLLMSAPLGGGPSFCERVERLGGHANAETGLEQMLFYARVHADDVGAVVDLLCRSVFLPELTEDLLNRERAVVVQELESAAVDPSDVVQDAMLAALFPGHPLGRPVGGTIDEVRAATLAEVTAHHASDFLTRPVALVVVAPDPAVEVSGYGSNLPSTATVVPSRLPQVARRAPSWPNGYAWMCMGARSPARNDRRRDAHRLLATLLGPSPASRLYRRLRSDLGLAYSFHTWERGYTEAGAWRVLVGVGEGNGDRVVETVRSVLAGVVENGVPDEDLRQARRQVEMGVILDTDSPLELAKLVANRTHSGTTSWSADEEVDALRAVTADAVVAAADEVLRDLVTVVRPEA